MRAIAPGVSIAWNGSKVVNMERVDLEEIVILTNPDEEDDMLIACLRILFLEWEVLMCSAKRDTCVD